MFTTDHADHQTTTSTTALWSAHDHQYSTGAHHTTTQSVLTQVRGLEVNSAHARKQVTSLNDDGSEGDKDGGEVDGKVKWNDWF